MGADAVIISDYHIGTLTDKIVKFTIDKANKLGKKVIENGEYAYEGTLTIAPYKVYNEDGSLALKRGKKVADTAKRDTENIPLTEDIHIYIAREVLPYNRDAWVDESQTKSGFEIPFTRTFYEYKEIEPSADIAARIAAREQSLMARLRELFGGVWYAGEI